MIYQIFDWWYLNTVEIEYFQCLRSWSQSRSSRPVKLFLFMRLRNLWENPSQNSGELTAEIRRGSAPARNTPSRLARLALIGESWWFSPVEHTNIIDLDVRSLFKAWLPMVFTTIQVLGVIVMNLRLIPIWPSWAEVMLDPRQRDREIVTRKKDTMCAERTTRIVVVVFFFNIFNNSSRRLVWSTLTRSEFASYNTGKVLLPSAKRTRSTILRGNTPMLRLATGKS